MQVKSLSRKDNHRKSLMRNLLTSIILYEKIQTTRQKAKNVLPMIERIFVIAKKNDLIARRKLLAVLYDKKAVDKVFEVIVPRFKNISSGFVRVYNIGPRKGDSAYMVMMKLAEGEAIKTLESKDAQKNVAEDAKSKGTTKEKSGTKKAK